MPAAPGGFIPHPRRLLDRLSASMPQARKPDTHLGDGVKQIWGLQRRANQTPTQARKPDTHPGDGDT